MTPSDPERLTDAWDALLLTLGGPPPEGLSTSEADKSAGHKVPVTVLGGFLGAGKTTLLCQLLEVASIDIVAIVNDLASVNVDAASVRARNAETIELENGCACCVLGTDLRETLYAIGCRAQPPDAIVIEASGIADPMGIAQTVANVQSMTLDGIVAVVDAQTFPERASDPVTAHLFERQLAAAHLIALTKTAPRDDVVALRDALGCLAPGRPVLVSDLLFENGTTGVDVLLGAATRGARPAPAIENHAYDGFAVETVELLHPISASRFFELLDNTPDAVYRLKGWVCLEEARADPAPAGIGPATRFEVQAAGAHWRVVPQAGPGEGSQLVVIGRCNDRGFETFLSKLRGLNQISCANSSHG
jgi:G3E family GTPase